MAKKVESATLNSKPKHPGAPRKYDRKKIYEIVCERIAINGEFAEDICKEPGMPEYSTFRLWKDQDSELSALYTKARTDSADALAREALRVAYDDSQDSIFVTVTDKDGEGVKRIYNSEFVNRSRLKVDTLKWLACKRDPKKYGDRATLEHEVGETLASLCEQALKHGK